MRGFSRLVAIASVALVPSAFATSLAIAGKGATPEMGGLEYAFTLTWAARPGAGAYRLMMWTDATHGWYRVAQVSATSVPTRAFRSGCTAFVVLAMPSASAPNAAAIDTTNIVRFPFAEKPALCPAGMR